MKKEIMKMIENHNFSKKSYELVEKPKRGSDKVKRDLMNHEIEAIQTYSMDFNRLFPAMSTVEFIYALIGAKKCVEKMFKTLLEHEPKLKIHVNLLDAAFDDAIKTRAAIIDESEVTKMMKGTGNDG